MKAPARQELALLILTTSTTATSLLTLVPAIICARNVELDNAIQVYHDDLPSPELVAQEIIRWKLRHDNLPPNKRPSTVAAAIKECDSLYFLNIRVLLKIACTLLVTSCECERSASPQLVRLASGPTPTEGRVELYYNGSPYDQKG
ncbi:hypothetical protein EMCRGX_G005002 [Ephydatia muelleri]